MCYMYKFLNINLLSAILVIMILFNSCATVYIPNAANVPLIGEKGEVQAGITTGTSNLDFQSAYGLTDNIAIMANATYSNKTSDSINYHKHFMGEGAVGYFKKVGRSGRLEVYGGMGYGSTTDNEENYSFSGDYAKGDYAKFFVQANIGSTSDIFDGAMSLRLCDAYFMNFRYLGLDYGNENNIYIEPVLTGKVGYKNLKFIMQMGFSIPVQQSSVMSFNPFILNIGLNFKINTIKSKPIY